MRQIDSNGDLHSQLMAYDTVWVDLERISDLPKWEAASGNGDLGHLCTRRSRRGGAFPSTDAQRHW